MKGKERQRTTLISDEREREISSKQYSHYSQEPQEEGWKEQDKGRGDQQLL